MIDEQQVEIQGVEDNVARLISNQARQQFQNRLAPGRLGQPFDQSCLGFASECGVCQKEIPQALAHAQEDPRAPRP